MKKKNFLESTQTVATAQFFELGNSSYKTLVINLGIIKLG